MVVSPELALIVAEVVLGTFIMTNK